MSAALLSGINVRRLLAGRMPAVINAGRMPALIGVIVSEEGGASCG